MGIGIFSNDAGQLTINFKEQFPFDITSSDGDSFEEAQAKLKKIIQEHPLFTWMQPFLVERGAPALKNVFFVMPRP